MPIIVDEVVISVEVGNREAGGDGSPVAGAPPAADRQALVEECVARVLEILRDRQEP